MRFQSYFNTALLIIQAYKGDVPLAHYLKQYFAQHKKHGSKDRKYIAHLCYCYYRLGHALPYIAVAERLKTALFLCNDNIAEWAVLFDDAWLTNHAQFLQERVSFIQSIHPFNIADIFPKNTALSDGIDINTFAVSHLIQPNLFLRARPGKRDAVIQKLQQHNIPFTALDNNTIALLNSTKIEGIITLNKEAVVQDYSSRQIQQFFSLIPTNPQTPVTVWDCCAASGGKSILAVDSFTNIALTVSDVRPSIIHNLQQRFTEAGIKNYKSFVADLSLTPSALHLQPFYLVLSDVPCTGSGTWGRTPEQLYFFTQEKLTHYTTLQRNIVNTIIPHIQKGGYLLYITCSVFKPENEAMVETIQQRHGLALIQQKLLTGYANRADTMFAALFKN